MGISAAANSVGHMCGILTVFGKRESLDIGLCDQALMMLRQRGPDYQHSSVQMGGRLYLGQTVLSITGNGRMPDLRERRYAVLFNGEIYNHAVLYSVVLRPERVSWNSGTDTEVLAKLHSILSPAEVYKRLSGMFIYVVYDRAKGKLLVGRDMIGEKFLYCYEDEHVMILSSEVGPILCLVPTMKMDYDVLREYFFTRHLLTTEQTVWKGITVVPPGQLREYDFSEPRGWNTLYIRSLSLLIDPQRTERNKKAREEDIAEELEITCREAAGDLCPQIAYASVVSGGVDSSLASWFMCENTNKPTLLALQFPGKDPPSSDKSLDEFEAAEPGWKIERHSIGEETYRNHLNLCYEVACSPLPTHSYVSQAILAEVVHANGLKVLIVGEGGDEFFGGYDAYLYFNVFDEIPSANPSPYSGFVSCGVEFEGWQPEDLHRRQSEQWRLALECYGEGLIHDRTVQAALLLDATVQLRSVGIRSADQMSLAYGVEARSFYLHERLMKFALNLPADYKVDYRARRGYIAKPLLMKLFARTFGADLIRRPKNGFSGWPNEAGRVLVGPDYRMVREILGPFKLNARYQHGFSWQRKLWHAAEWKLQNLELFLRRFANYA